MKAIRLPLVYYNSIVANSLYGLFGLLILLGCFAILHGGDPRARWIVWLWIIGLGNQVLPVIWRIFDRTPQFTITISSVIDHARRAREIFWIDVKEASLWDNRDGTYIFLEIINAEKYLSQLSPLQRRRGMTSVGKKLDLLGFLPMQRRLKKCSKAFALDFTGVKADSNEVLAIIQSLISQARENAPQ
ncbi:hypothetical protein FNT36_05060 [Hymenobacter setariae]|uniref:Uncharacterized protein n=1 Tax=Hymenobacter setariae TaxID=2594794 RepID=A0A558C3V7_9BACT|nr:STM3941 family protein [Hymenobacter setariae]TVT43458.1 hypothetical protein FNT36_05060 [Hymenobacter setariae]